MPWAAVATVVVGAYSANQQGKAAKNAAGAQGAASDATIAEQRRQFDIQTQQRQPWIDSGTDALAQMGALNSGDFSSFKESPDYQFALQQGQQGLDRGAAARGSLYSGGHTADTIKYGQGMAAQQYGTFYSRLSDLASGGNATAGSLGAQGMNMANSIGNAYQNNANAQRQSSYNQANAWSNFGQQATGAFGQWYGGLGSDGQGKYLGNNRGAG